MQQNIECQPEIQFVETTPNNETQLQQQFLSQQNIQQTFQGQNYPPPPPQNVPQPQYNVNPQQYEFRPAPPQNVKVVMQVNFVEQQFLCNSSRQAIMIHCPYCRTNGMTQITYTMGIHSWILVLFLCFTFVCCWIPCFCKDCQNVNHFCSNCGQQVGQVRYGKKPERQEQKQEKIFTTGEKLGFLALRVLLRAK